MRRPLLPLLGLLLCLSPVLADNWNETLNYNGRMPSCVFLIPMPPNTQLEISVIWHTSANLDIYLYAFGTDFMSESPGAFL